MKKILITNDDGIFAPGLSKLIEIARPLGELTVIAPDSPRSGVGHAITLSTPLRLRELKSEEHYREFTCNGTPVDCVKMGLKILFDNQKPDLILSGINHGSNASSNVIYSGTMGAAIEGALEKVPSIGFSLLDYSHQANFEPSLPYLTQMIKQALAHPLPKGIALNVNIPNVSHEEIKGVKVCRQADAYWEESYERRKDPFQMEYFWLCGHFVGDDLAEDTDLYALNNHYISVVPVQFDLTAHQLLGDMNNWLNL